MSTTDYSKAWRDMSSLATQLEDVRGNRVKPDRGAHAILHPSVATPRVHEFLCSSRRNERGKADNARHMQSSNNSTFGALESCPRYYATFPFGRYFLGFVSENIALILEVFQSSEAAAKLYPSLFAAPQKKAVNLQSRASLLPHLGMSWRDLYLIVAQHVCMTQPRDFLDRLLVIIICTLSSLSCTAHVYRKFRLTSVYLSGIPRARGRAGLARIRPATNNDRGCHIWSIDDSPIVSSPTSALASWLPSDIDAEGSSTHAE